MPMPIVDILLSSYNGRSYLQQQFDSIKKQTETNWRLIIRDDGSGDETGQIVKRIAASDSRVVVSDSSGNNIGIVSSYIRLLQESDAPFFAFCDQDDYWLPDKLETLLGLLAPEAGNCPVLAYSDLVIVDEKLNEIYPSFMAQQRFSPERAVNWPENLLQNTVVGCACMGNRALGSLVLSRPPCDWSNIVMHDWWLCIVASRFGRILFESSPTVLYRQHSENQLGAKGTGFRRYVNSIRKEQPLMKVEKYLSRASIQAQAFQGAFQSQLNTEDYDLLGELSKLKQLHGPARTMQLLKCYRKNIRMQTSGRDLLVLLASVFG